MRFDSAARRPLWSALLLVVLASPLAARGADFHHVHLRAEDPRVAIDWYIEHMGGTATKLAGMDAVAFGDVTVLFFKGADAFEGSVGSSVDHIGLSFDDLDSKMKAFEEAGLDIVAPARTLGSIKFGFVKDPWGTLIEVMQDHNLLGFHHIHLHATDPDAALGWYADALGGERGKYLGILPAVRYGKIWVLAQKIREEKAPTIGRSLDHLGWSVADLDGLAEKLKAQGVEFTVEPRPFGPARIAFIEGPGGVRIELVQLPGSAAGAD
jgi:lactoylglutathione lyase